MNEIRISNQIESTVDTVITCIVTSHSKLKRVSLIHLTLFNLLTTWALRTTTLLIQENSMTKKPKTFRRSSITPFYWCETIQAGQLLLLTRPALYTLQRCGLTEMIYRLEKDYVRPALGISRTFFAERPIVAVSLSCQLL